MRKIFLSLSLATFTSLAIGINFGFARDIASAQSSPEVKKEAIDIAHKVCAEGIQETLKKAERTLPQKSVKDYCQCGVEAITSRYGFEDFAKNEKKYTEQLIKDGAFDKCFKFLQPTK
jgi:hypothetical protein